jgi:TP901 family phage tail tape measure protein
MAQLQSTLKLTLLDQVSNRAKHISRTLDGLNRQTHGMLAMTRNVAAFAGAYFGITEGIEHTYTAASKMQASLAEVGIKAGLSNTALEAMQRQLTALSPKVNQTTADLLSGVDSMVTLGLATDKAMASIPAIAKAATATGASISDLSSASTSAIQNMGVLPEQVTKMLDAMALAGNAGAFELRDMAQYFPQLTASAKTLGIDGVDGVADLAAALQIARRGSSDASTAANNLSDFMSKIVTPQTVKNFKKFGVNVTAELKKAHKNGISPIEHFIKLLDEKTQGGKGELLTQIFGDKQTLDFIRPMIADFKEYVRIREEAERANGTVDSAFSKRMETNAEKVKALKIAVDNLGTSIGANLLTPVGDAAKYFADIFNTLDQRSTVFDRIGTSLDGFLNGLGFDGAKSFGEAMKSLDKFLFGVKDGSKAADEIGGIFAKFQGYGQQVKQFGDDVADAVAKVERFLGLKPGKAGEVVSELSSWGFKLGAAAIGIGLAAGAISGLVRALIKLSGVGLLIGGAKGIASLLGAVAGFGKTPAKVPTPGKTPGKTPTTPKVPPVLPEPPAFFTTWAARLSLWASAAFATYKALDDIPHEGLKSAQDHNPELLQDLERQRRIRSEFKGGFEGGRHAAYAGVGPRPGDKIPGEIENQPTGYRKQTESERYATDMRSGFTERADRAFTSWLDRFDNWLKTPVEKPRFPGKDADDVYSPPPKREGNFWIDRLLGREPPAGMIGTDLNPGKLRDDRNVGVQPVKQDTNYWMDRLLGREPPAGMIGTDLNPGKLQDDRNVGVQPVQQPSMWDSVKGLLGQQATQAGSKTVAIDQSSIAAMIRPSGTQDVRVTNKEPPQVHVNVGGITITGVVDPKAALSSAASQLGEKVKSAVESANTD